MAIEIELLAKTVELLKGSKESAMALDEVRGSLEGVSDEGKQLEENLKVALDNVLAAELEFARRSTQTFDEMTAEQQDAFRARFDTEERFARESEALSKRREQAEQRVLADHELRVKDTYEQVASSAEEASQKVAEYSERGFEKAGDSADDLGEKVKGKLSDSFRQWDGTAEGAVESVASSLQGLAGIIPGIGGLVGAGLGVVISEWGKEWRDTAKENASRVRSMYDDMIASGQDYLSEQFVQNKISDILHDAQAFAEVEQLARDAGLAIDEVLAARAGSKPALESVLARVNEQLETALELQKDGTFESQEELVAVENKIIRLDRVREVMAGVLDEQNGVVDQVDLFNAALDTARGNIIANQEQIQIQNRLLAETPTVLPVQLDFTAADREYAAWASRRRRVAVELGIEQGGRIIR